jgi:hypothetical protein
MRAGRRLVVLPVVSITHEPPPVLFLPRPYLQDEAGAFPVSDEPDDDKLLHLSSFFLGTPSTLLIQNIVQNTKTIRRMD